MSIKTEMDAAAKLAAMRRDKTLPQFIDGMRAAAGFCKAAGADYSYDIIMTAIDTLEIAEAAIAELKSDDE